MHVTFKHNDWVVHIICPESGKFRTFPLEDNGRYKLQFNCEHGDSTVEVQALSIAGGRRGVKRLRTDFSPV